MPVEQVACRRCGQEKPLGRFYPNPRYKAGYATWCRDCHKEYRAERYVRTREKTLAQNRDWYVRNPEARKRLAVQKEAARRARHRGAAGRTTVQQREWRREFYGNRCWMCGEEANGMDHVIPLARGGSNWPANLRPACLSCNASKGDTWKGVITCQLLSTKLTA